jgi:hypothetical protein
MSTDLRIQKTKEALHRALLELLKGKTLEIITVSEICRKQRSVEVHFIYIIPISRNYLRSILWR